jgi:hypothetical protein
MSRALTMEFLFDARVSGRLPAPSSPAPDVLVEEMAIRFVVYQDTVAGERSDCREIVAPTELRPEAGDVLHIDEPVRVWLAESTAEPPVRVRFNPRQGSELRFQVGGVPVVLAPPIRADAVEVCSVQPTTDG